MDLLKILTERRDALKGELDEFLSAIEGNEERSDKNLSEAEQSEYDAKRDEVKILNERIAQMAADIEEQRAADDAARKAIGAEDKGGAPLVVVGREEPTYRKGDAPGDHSYYRDLVNVFRSGDPEARERLMRNNAQVRDHLAAKHELRDLSRTDTTSVGEFVPPAWLLELYQPGIRASARITANLVRAMPLPGGTDSLNVPRISTNPTVAAQTADNAAVNEVDAVSATVTAPVVTFAGQNDVALQVLEQSPLAGGFDELIFAELADDMDRYVDLQVLNGSGTSGQVKGILAAVASGNKSAYTDASPTQPEMYPSFGKVLSLTTTARKKGVEAWVMHNRRWYWLMAALDSSNRPYVTPVANGPQNAYGVATADGAGQAEGLVGYIAGVPVFIDPNVPVLLTNGAGAAGTEDIVIAGRFSDAILFEGALRTRVLPEVGSGTLSVRLQVYEYAAFTAERAAGNSFGTIYDTGMAAPSGY